MHRAENEVQFSIPKSKNIVISFASFTVKTHCVLARFPPPPRAFFGADAFKPLPIICQQIQGEGYRKSPTNLQSVSSLGTTQTPQST